MSNIYDNPEHFGLEVVKDHDAIGGWEFDTVVVWRRGDDYFIGADSGCSCPTPFDDLKLTDLKPVQSKADVAEFARVWWGDWRDADEVESHVAALMDGLVIDTPWPPKEATTQ
jgi:hypothetical protein